MERNIDIADIENTLEDIRERLESVTLRDLAALVPYPVMLQGRMATGDARKAAIKACLAADAFLEAREVK